MNSHPRLSQLTLLTTLGLSGALAAQEVSIASKPSEGALRYTIRSTVNVASERTITRDGEAVGGRGGFGGPSAQKATAEIVFDEAAEDGATVRTYRTATATVKAPDREGEDQESEIEGGYLGERLYLVNDDRGMVITRGEADGEELPRFAAMGMPERTSLAGITPEQPLEVGAEFTFPAKFLTALEGLNHPIRPAMEGFARGAGRRPGGQGGDRPEQDGADPRQPRGGDGADQPRRRAGGDARSMMRRMRGVPGGEIWQMLSNTSLEGAVTGKLVAVEDGIARIAITTERGGEGSAEDLGMGMGAMFGGRGARAGGRQGGQGPQGESSGEAALKMTGELLIDTTSGQVTRLTLQGTTSSRMFRSMEMRDSLIEIDQASEGDFTMTVEIQAAPETGDK